MARHSSNRERIERMAKEAEVGRQEKAAGGTKKDASAKKTTKKTAKKTAKKTTRKTASKSVERTRIVWLVCDQSGSAVKTYPYPEEKAAREEAERRTKDTGKTHFVTRGEVPFE